MKEMNDTSSSGTMGLGMADWINTTAKIHTSKTEIYEIQKSALLKTNFKLYKKYRKILDPFLSMFILLDNKITFIKIVKYKIKKLCIFV